MLLTYNYYGDPLPGNGHLIVLAWVGKRSILTNASIAVIARLIVYINAHTMEPSM